ncbi:MAG: hypothetical protein AB7U82_31435 [Blastocatellales bacterium]
MSKHFLRLEAVNLANFVYDTKDLSTIRGGGLLLLEAVKKLPADKPELGLKVLSVGASIGLYEFDSDKPGEIAEKVNEYLRSHEQLQYATFVVDVKEASDDFKRDLEKLMAMNRWSQMQSPSIVIDEWNSLIKTDNFVCDLDGVRPAVEPMPGPEKEEQVSQSVYVRRKHGREQKQEFYELETEKTLQRDFAYDFNEIAEQFGDEDYGNLNRKMAVIYLDGNKFGDKKGKTLESLRDFDEGLKNNRREMLGKLLDRIESEQGWMSKDGRYRFETLLWGGDEIIWVVPAWKGWETLAYFFEKSKGWKAPSGKPLHHAGGMVFCNHKAPIHRIVKLAKEGLADLAKRKSRDESLIAYEVLESFDHTGDDLERYRRDRRPKFCRGDEQDPMTIKGEDMVKIPKLAATIKETISHRKLHETVKYLLDNDPPSEKDRREWESKTGNPYGALMKSLNSENAKSSLREIQPLLGGEWKTWFHLSTLWDYLG